MESECARRGIKLNRNPLLPQACFLPSVLVPCYANKITSVSQYTVIGINEEPQTPTPTFLFLASKGFQITRKPILAQRQEYKRPSKRIQSSYNKMSGMDLQHALPSCLLRCSLAGGNLGDGGQGESAPSTKGVFCIYIQQQSQGEICIWKRLENTKYDPYYSCVFKPLTNTYDKTLNPMSHWNLNHTAERTSSNTGQQEGGLRVTHHVSGVLNTFHSSPSSIPQTTNTHEY